eukprot:TRINITY_DN4386_c0_g1_i1.p1 TRINITY_DN4386_c0_g1~~TRINITY_DN4386_c0_g1_i1.p1  ORF type:complete len:239 (+),score=48.11 TRINITY_DN4386_c0_g1_i1:545-1261(+)
MFDLLISTVERDPSRWMRWRQVGVLQHPESNATVQSTHQYELGGRGMVGVVLEFGGCTVQLCCLHVAAAIRKGGDARIREVAMQVGEFYRERTGGEHCSWVLCADFNMELRDLQIRQIWEEAGGRVQCTRDFTVSRSDNRLDCFDGFISFGLPAEIQVERVFSGLMPKYLAPTQAKPNGDSQLRYAGPGWLLECGDSVEEGALVVWESESPLPTEVVPNSAVAQGLSDHLLVIGLIQL